MYGFEYLYNLSVFVKVVLILGTCVIIGLAIRAGKSDDKSDNVLTQLNTKNSKKYTVNTEKQLIQGVDASLPTINSDINNCADECSKTTNCGGFNYINNQCQFIAGTISRPATLTASGLEITAYLRVQYH